MRMWRERFRKACLPVGILSILLASVGVAVGEVRLPHIFSDHMVLQQQAAATVWGWAQPGKQITLSATWGASAMAVADETGAWHSTIKTHAAGGPFEMTVRGSNEIKLTDVMIGEVWVCSGQSNMEWPMSRLDDDTSIAAADHPEIRLFTAGNQFAIRPRNDCEGQWRACNPRTARDFSAVGYFFGKELQEHLGVPVGLISTNWGGTPAEAWTSEETLRALGGFSDQLKILEELRDRPAETQQEYTERVRHWQQEAHDRDKGYPENWRNPELDDSSWETMTLPGQWDADILKDFDGSVWFRRRFQIPDAMRSDEAGWQLSLGPIDDEDQTWINGALVGQTSGWTQDRFYSVGSELLRQGQNVIIVRVWDSNGRGGFGGKPEQMTLKPTNATAAPVDLAGPWRYRVGIDLKDLPPYPQQQINARSATVLYNGMIAPLSPFAIQGAIWYQGENNVNHPDQYRVLFPAMITDWRNHWGQGDFSFYYVQIAPYDYGGRGADSAYLREAQMLAMSTPNTGMAVTLDIGNFENIHPLNKKDVGKRLALWARAKTYGQKDLVYSGPLYKEMRIDDGKICLYFDHVDGGLVAQDGKLTDFEIAGKDGQFVPAEAVIDDDAVVVSSPQVAQPIAARYAFTNTPHASLLNKAGLPASSFRTDCPDVHQNAMPEAPTASLDPELEKLLNRLEQRCGELHSLQADMRYQQTQLLLDEVRLLSGRMVYQDRDDVVKFRIAFDQRKDWELGDPEPEPFQKYEEDFVFDGLWLHNRNARNKSLQSWEVSKEPKNRDAYRLGKGRFPLPFAITKADLLREFTVTTEPPGEDAPANTVRLHLVPKADGSFAEEYVNLNLWIDQGSFLPVRFGYETKNAEQYLCTWSDIQTGASLSKDLFELKPAGPDWNVQRTPLKQ